MQQEFNTQNHKQYSNALPINTDLPLSQSNHIPTPIVPSQLEQSSLNSIMNTLPATTTAAGGLDIGMGSGSGMLAQSTSTTGLPAAHQAAQAAAVAAATSQRKKLSGRYALSDFAVERTLGTGSFGRVHLVRSRHNGRFYAIKVLR